ncbi:MAG TPA: DoxX family protein [Segetibacter sp.]|jgi:putative oxidoreductase
MRRVFSTTFSPANINTALLLLRVAVAAFMLTHGLPKLMNMMSGNSQFGDPLGLGKDVSLGLTVFAEFVCSILLLLGLATRLALIPLIITMLVAAFVAHADDPFGKKEMALLYLVVFITLLITGPGKYSIDNALARNRR